MFVVRPWIYIQYRVLKSVRCKLIVQGRQSERMKKFVKFVLHIDVPVLFMKLHRPPSPITGSRTANHDNSKKELRNVQQQETNDGVLRTTSHAFAANNGKETRIHTSSSYAPCRRMPLFRPHHEIDRRDFPAERLNKPAELFR